MRLGWRGAPGRRSRGHLALAGLALAFLALIPTASAAEPAIVKGTPPQAAAPSAMPSGTAGFERMIDQSVARVLAANAQSELTGSGPYPAQMEVDLALPNATIYRPKDLGGLQRRKLGLLIWGNGGCSDDGASARAHLAEIASHGYFVLAPGRPLTGPLTLPGAPVPAPMRTTIQDMRTLLDWAFAENGRRGSPYHGRIDLRAVAAAGHSCGGMQAILLADDPRIKTLIVHNSGVMPSLPDNPPLVMHEERLDGIRRPTLIFLGGESDVVWKYGLRSFERIDNAPAMLLSRDVGHGGMFNQAHGGEIAKLAVAWLEWRLRGDQGAATPFAGPNCGLCRDAAWMVRKRSMQ